MLLYVVGLVVGALMTGIALQEVAQLLGRLPSMAMAAVAGVAALATARRRGFGSRWRVPQSWMRFGPRTFAGLFGVALGTGVATALPSLAFVVLLVAALALHSLSFVASLFLVYALARALPALLVASGGDDDQQARAAMSRLGSIVDPLAWLEVGLLLATAVAFVA